MSNLTNDRLLERAREAAEYWTGSLYERMIHNDIARGDLERLSEDVKNAEDAMFQAEYEPEEGDTQ